MLRPEHCSNYMTHLSRQTSHPQQRSSMDIQHKVQFFQDPSKKVNIHQICQRLVELQEKQKEQFDRAHWARDLYPLKVKEQVQFFPKQASHRPHQVDDWYCGWDTWMWRILHDPRPQQQSLQKESSSFEAHMSWWLLLSRPSSNERGNTAQRQFLSRPSGQARPDPCLSTTKWATSTMKWAIWTPGPWCLMAQRHVKHLQHHLHHHRAQVPLTYFTIILTPSIIPIQRVISWAQLRGLLTQRQEETPRPEPAFDQTLRHWPRTHTHRLSALLAETSPFGTPIDDSDRPKPKLKKKSSLTSDSPSRPFGSFQDHLVFT